MSSQKHAEDSSPASQPQHAPEMTIQKWMEVFGTIYGEVDSRRSPTEIWVGATSHFSTIGEAIRRMHFADLMGAAAHAFCWMCSFVDACQKEQATVFALRDSFSSIVACKYPLVCKHCRESPCHCNPQSMDKVGNKGAQYKDLIQRRKLLDDAPNTYELSKWCGIFGTIYAQNTHLLTLESIGFHFLEEAGEELTALRGLTQLRYVLDEQLDGIDEAFLERLATCEGVVEVYDKCGSQKAISRGREPQAIAARLVRAKMDMITEFADTFSWFCSVLNKIVSIATNCRDGNCHFTGRAFQEELASVYMPNGTPLCPSCEASPCACVFFNKRNSM